jgi:hypothetical protein
VAGIEVTAGVIVLTGCCETHPNMKIMHPNNKNKRKFFEISIVGFFSLMNKNIIK